MKGEITALVLVFLVLLQSSLLHALPVDEKILNSEKVPAPCRHPLRFIMKGTERIPCVEPGYLPECARCGSASQCLTRKCWGGKCVYNTQASKKKCFPVVLKPECASCTSASQCKQSKCWGGKCTDGSVLSLRRCFLPECAPCRSSLQCSTKKCWGGRCVYDTPRSLRKCFFPECHHCTRATQCSTKKCWGNKCVYNTPASMRKCFPRHPEPCHLLRQSVTDPEDVVRLRRVCP